ncbi:putative cutinase transcription factor 1 beta [Fusarium globosum]|uniref:Putative cutinase transcription factor 1 beta n=1 Tax=Fusarium globosum TaxID=78864 RepID=A0A8H5YDW0_9HYPO|nr:putative cutinase transcription factor 1 beta [Fusarium globosum]
MDPTPQKAQHDKRRRQQRKACDLCRRRKVRCDIVDRPSGPCSVCEKSGFECRSTAKWAVARRSSVVSRNAYDRDTPIRSPGVSQPDPDAGAVERDDHLSILGPEASSASSRRDKTSNDASRSDGQEKLAREGLARFFKHGIGAAAWAVFASTKSFRIAYVGTAVSNLVHLVDLHRSFRQPYSSILGDQQPLSAPTGPDTHGSFQESADGSTSSDRIGGKPLHYPYPPIRQVKSWKPTPNSWVTQDLVTEVSSFPAQEVRDALVQAYFDHIHPFLPIVSKPEFLARYRTPDNPPPLLLFQSVLMAGAHACPHPLVATDRHAVQNRLFRRASMLYHMRHESDRMHLLQAAALFTWHIGDGDTVAGGPWYWAGIAVRIGTGLGAHRRSSQLPATEMAQYRRCWWSAFFCEVFSSLETGRPCAVRAEDIDQLPLQQEDITDTPSNDPTIAESGVSPDFLNHLVDLAYIGLDVIALNAPARDRLIDVASIDARLGLWSLRSGISTVAEDDDSWTCHLRMHYNLLLLHLHRNLHEQSSQSICSAAAQAIVTSLEKLTARDELRQCHFTSVSAVTAAGIQFAGEIRAAVASQTFLVAINALERLSRLLRSTILLARHWPNAEAVHSVFEELHREYETLVTQRLQGEQVMVPESPPDWNRLLGGEGLHQFSNFTSDQDWMNINSWTDLL